MPDLGDKAVTSAWESFDEARSIWVVVQCLAQFFHRAVEAVVEVNEGVSRPEALAKLFSRNDFTWILEKN